MQPYTHLGIGLALAKGLFPESPFDQAAVIAGSVMSDLPATIQWYLDKRQGIKPFSQMSCRFRTLHEIVHSIPLWLWTTLYPPLYLGLYSHLALDLLTHRREESRDIDPSLMFPLPFHPRGLVDYRNQSDDLLRPWDILITLTCTAYFLYGGSQ